MVKTRIVKGELVIEMFVFQEKNWEAMRTSHPLTHKDAIHKKTSVPFVRLLLL